MVLNVTTQTELNKIRNTLEKGLILENDNLSKIILAIGSSQNRTITDEEIKELTELSMDSVVKSIDLLDKSNFITTFIRDIPNRSLHTVCQLTEKGEDVLKLLTQK